jgi:UDP-N-acetylmuramoyl-L-alanyl-D-glutamate--2,6-diaminopimelate ligase
MGWGTWGALQDTLNTTPDALAIQNMLSDFVSQRKKTVVMEVSSHGLQQGRVNGIAFKGALFTNLSRDHLDYHGTMEEYLAAKLKLFKWPGLGFVVLNLDDSSADDLLKPIDDAVKVWGFSSKGVTNATLETVSAKNIKHSLDGIQFDVCRQGQCRTVKTSLAGVFNLENVLAVLTVLLAMDMSLDTAVKRIAVLKPVAGRMENFGGDDKPAVFVDYAHSPDALDKVLAGLRPHCHNKLRLVFGCGGDRDKGKRAQMGAVAEKWADEVVLTDDNPRSEQPQAIVNDILSGCVSDKVTVIHNREQAIQTVINNADKRDCIVIAGKGHESYQEVKGIRLPFSDQQVVRETLLGLVNQVGF